MKLITSIIAIFVAIACETFINAFSIATLEESFAVTAF
jgi:hypothetical protein